MSNAAGSEDIETVLFVSPRITQQPVANILAENGTIQSLVCEGESFPYPEYEWTKIDDDEVVGNDSMLVFNPVVFGDEGTYVLLLAMNYLCNHLKPLCMVSRSAIYTRITWVLSR